MFVGKNGYIYIYIYVFARVYHFLFILLNYKTIDQ